MVHFVYCHDSYVALLTDFSKLSGAVMKTDQSVELPESIGYGFARAIDFPDGLSVLIFDCRFGEEMLFSRNKNEEDHYILHFDELTAEQDFRLRIDNVVNGEYKTAYASVQLSRSALGSERFISANARYRSLKVMFSSKWLTSYLGDEAHVNAIARYLKLEKSSCHIEPIDLEYRLLMNEIIIPEITHPLKNIFLYNRVLLLIERFMLRFHNRINDYKGELRMTDEQINRLMEVEYNLVNNFTQMPPTIQQLSRIAAMSPTKLKIIFKKVYGIPLYEYYQRNRLKTARKLLQSRKYSVKEVGLNVGYSNLSHFAAAFRKEFGILPSELLEIPSSN
jgi:AraC-like DNA-binding protein